MSTDISQIITYKNLIRENKYKIDKIGQENAELVKAIKNLCTHPTHSTVAVEDDYGKVIGYTKQCTLCGEYLEE